jgi:hypothetical protein
MTDQTLKILRSTPPSRLASLREIAPQIAALESKLGLPQSPPVWNVSKAQARLKELEALGGQTSAPAAAAPVRKPRDLDRDHALAAANARRYELETQLGLPVSGPTIGAERLAAEIAELESKLAAQAPAATTAPTAPAASAPAVPTLPANTMLRADFDKLSFERRNAHMADGGKVVAQAPAPVAAGLMATPRLAALCAHVFGGPVSYPDDPNARAICLSKLRQAGVEIAGVEPDPHKTEVTGFARTFKAALQAKADEFLARK